LAWDKGNLPVDCITLEEFSLLVAFESGVKGNGKSKSQNEDGEFVAMDPRNIPALQSKRLKRA